MRNRASMNRPSLLSASCVPTPACNAPLPPPRSQARPAVIQPSLLHVTSLHFTSLPHYEQLPKIIARVEQSHAASTNTPQQSHLNTNPHQSPPSCSRLLDGHTVWRLHSPPHWDSSKQNECEIHKSEWKKREASKSIVSPPQLTPITHLAASSIHPDHANEHTQGEQAVARRAASEGSGPDDGKQQIWALSWRSNRGPGWRMVVVAPPNRGWRMIAFWRRPITALSPLSNPALPSFQLTSPCEKDPSPLCRFWQPGFSSVCSINRGWTWLLTVERSSKLRNHKPYSFPKPIQGCVIHFCCEVVREEGLNRKKLKLSDRAGGWGPGIGSGNPTWSNAECVWKWCPFFSTIVIAIQSVEVERMENLCHLDHTLALPRSIHGPSLISTSQPFHFTSTSNFYFYFQQLFFSTELRFVETATRSCWHVYNLKIPEVMWNFKKCVRFLGSSRVEVY